MLKYMSWTTMYVELVKVITDITTVLAFSVASLVPRLSGEIDQLWG